MEDIPISNRFFTNRDGNTLMNEFEGILDNNPQVKNLDAVVGFLRASGYFTLRPFLDNINKVRILIGIDVDKYIARAHQKGELFFGAEDEVKEDCLRQLKEDIEHSQYSKRVEDGMLQMVQDMIDGKLELRAHPPRKSMPSSIFSILIISISTPLGQPSQAAVISVAMDWGLAMTSSMSLM